MRRNRITCPVVFGCGLRYSVKLYLKMPSDLLTGPGSFIENHPMRAVIFHRIMEGKSVRAVCEGIVPAVSPMSIQRYKSNIVKPILAKVREGETPSVLKGDTETPLVPDQRDMQIRDQVQKAIQDAPVVSVFRARLEKLHLRIDRTLDKGESAVRVSTDKDGNEIWAGQDLSPLAPLFNAASKNLEMLGRATGELEPAGGSQVSIQIVCPSTGSGEMPRITFSLIDQIEAAEPGEDEDGCLEIGVLQKPE